MDQCLSGVYLEWLAGDDWMAGRSYNTVQYGVQYSASAVLVQVGSTVRD